jgi:hypothetical protein
VRVLFLLVGVPLGAGVELPALLVVHGLFGGRSAAADVDHFEPVRQLVPIPFPVVSSLSSGELFGWQGRRMHTLSPPHGFCVNIVGHSRLHFLLEVFLYKFDPAVEFIHEYFEGEALRVRKRTVLKGVMGTFSWSSMKPKRGR